MAEGNEQKMRVAGMLDREQVGQAMRDMMAVLGVEEAPVADQITALVAVQVAYLMTLVPHAPTHAALFGLVEDIGRSTRASLLANLKAEGRG